MGASPKGGRVKRIEPTIGGWDASIDAATLERSRRASRERRVLRSLRDGLEIVLLCALLIGGTLVAAAHFGWPRYPADFAWTNTPARTIVLGMVVLCLGHVIAIALSFRDTPWRRLLLLLVPGLPLFDLRLARAHRVTAVFYAVGMAIVLGGLLAMP